MRLIDADAMRTEWRMGEFCEECKRDVRQCASDYCFTRMDVCGMIDDAPTITIDGWISVKDQMPSNNQMVIGYTPVDGRVFVGFCRTVYYSQSDRPLVHWYIGASMRSTKRMMKKVTHWMPLPKPPEGE